MVDRVRGLDDDFETVFIEGSKKYEWKLKDFSASEVQDIFVDKLETIDKLTRSMMEGDASATSLLKKEWEFAKDIYMTGLIDFDESSWKEVTSDKKITRGSLVKFAKEIASFLVEMDMKEEMQLLRQRLNTAKQSSSENTED